MKSPKNSYTCSRSTV